MGMHFFAPYVLVILTTPEFYPAATAVGFFVFGQFLFAINDVLKVGMNIEARTHLLPIRVVFAGVLNVGAGLLLIPPFGIAGAALLLLAACSSPPREAAPPPDLSALPPPGIEAGKIEAGGIEAEPAAAEAPLSVEYIPMEAPPPGSLAIAIPEVSGWSHSEVPLTRQQSDIEACHGYAAARVARDARIDEDRRQLREDSNDLVGLTTFARRVDFYSEPRRRADLFDTCMSARGYTRR